MNIYYAQLGEAISLAQHEIFEYKRISLILFDNIIENLLQSQNYQKLRHLLVLRQIDKSNFEKIIKGFNEFDNIISQSKKLGIISEHEKPIIKYCHSKRNNLYHKLFEDERITDFCISVYCQFLEKYFIPFLESGITSYSVKEKASSNVILKKENIVDFNQLLQKLNKLNTNYPKSSQMLLSDILSDYVVSFENFYECNAHESWSEFNKITKNQYFYDFEVKRKEHKEVDFNQLIPQLRKKWYDIDEKNIYKIKQEINHLKSLELGKSFEKFENLTSKLEPIYIGILLYYSEQEYGGSLVEE